MRPAHRVSLAAGAVLLAACGLGPLGDEPGGDENLPTLGAGPYEKLPLDLDTPADEPFLLADRTAHLRDPSALRRPDGGIRIWFSRRGDEGREEIWRAELPAVTELPDVGPELALAADQPWEEGRVAAPSVVDLGGGELLLFYEGGAGDRAIGLARSRDGGASWEKAAENPVLERAARPSAAAFRGEILLYAEEVSRGRSAILRAAGPTAGELSAPVEVLRPGAAGSFDQLSVGDPHIAVRVTGGGRAHYGLFYVGERLDPEDEGGRIASIGFAGSFDGFAFERFNRGQAVLDAAGPSERGPAALLEPARGLLLFSELRGGRLRIAGAVHER